MDGRTINIECQLNERLVTDSRRRNPHEVTAYEKQYWQPYRLSPLRFNSRKEQYHHRCKCPKQFFWTCDGDCENCEHHLGYGTLSLDASNTDDGNSLLDTELTEAVRMEEIYADRTLFRRNTT